MDVVGSDVVGSDVVGLDAVESNFRLSDGTLKLKSKQSRTMISARNAGAWYYQAGCGGRGQWTEGS